MKSNDLVERYLADLARRGRGPHTLRGYRSDLRTFVGQAVDIESFDLHGLARYEESLGQLAPSSAARRLSAVRGFLRWAEAHGVGVGDDALEIAEPAASQARWLEPSREAAIPVMAPDPEAVRAALRAVPLHADRDQLLFRLLAQVGLRPGEVLALRGDAFDEASGHLEVSGWGGSRRRVLLDETEVRLRLTHWIRATDPGNGPLFRGRGRASPLRYQSVAQRWTHYTATVGVRIRLGDLRRFHAAQLIAGGVPEWAVRERLGQPRGPLPVPRQATSDEEIRRWRARILEADRPTVPQVRTSRRTAG
jgi:integrase